MFSRVLTLLLFMVAQGGGGHDQVSPSIQQVPLPKRQAGRMKSDTLQFRKNENALVQFDHSP